MIADTYAVAYGYRTSASRGHPDAIAEAEPSRLRGCEDCLREGARWVHPQECAR